MERYRNSELAQARLCRFAYAKTYVEHEPGLPSPSLHSGSNVHAALAEAVRRVVAGDPVLNVHDIAYRIVRGGSAEYAEALAVLTDFQEALVDDFTIDPDGVFLLEDTLTMPIELFDGTTVEFYGTPDMGETLPRRTVRITDWKTHWQPETQEEFEADPQLKRYALLVAHHFPRAQRFELVKRFVRYWGNKRELTITRDELEQVRNELISEIMVVRELRAAGDYRATPGGWCGVCRHHASCPVIRDYAEHGTDIVSISDDEKATQLAGAIVALDAMSNRLKDAVKAYLGDEHRTGRLELPGGSYGYAPVMDRSVDVAALRDAMEEAGAELPEWILRVDLRALDKLKKRVPENVVRAIDHAMQVRETSRCQFRRAPASPAKIATPAPEPEGVTL